MPPSIVPVHMSSNEPNDSRLRQTESTEDSQPLRTVAGKSQHRYVRNPMKKLPVSGVKRWELHDVLCTGRLGRRSHRAVSWILMQSCKMIWVLRWSQKQLNKDMCLSNVSRRFSWKGLHYNNLELISLVMADGVLSNTDGNASEYKINERKIIHKKLTRPQSS